MATVTFLRCTVLRPADGVAHDVELDVEPSTPVNSLPAALPVPTAGQRVYIGPVPLDLHGTVGDSPLTSGCLISAGTPGPDYAAVPSDAAGTLRVIGGPDAGRWTWVSAGGRVVVGRGGQADLAAATEERRRAADS